MEIDNKGYSNLFIRLREPDQCNLWNKNNLTTEDLEFEIIQIYLDESHFSRSLVRCKECGQLYYSEFYEIIDWDDGDDNQFRTYIPIDSNPNIIENLNNMSPLELLGCSPRLQRDNASKIQWRK